MSGVIDPQVRERLAAAAGSASPFTRGLQGCRDAYAASCRNSISHEKLKRVSGISIAGKGNEIPARLYEPDGAPEGLVIYFHGGGFICCDLDTHDGICRNLAGKTGCVVLSVGFRLAPEHKFPAGLDDCLAAARWALDSAENIAGKGARTVIAGDSAGGNFVCTVTQILRDEGDKRLVGQAMVYPVTSYPDDTHASYQECAEGFGLSRAAMEYFWDLYLNSKDEARLVTVSPLLADNFADLPPALIMSAEFDVLRDEGEAYGVKLEAAGVATETRRCEGLNHGFLFWPEFIDRAAAEFDHLAAWIRDRVATGR